LEIYNKNQFEEAQCCVEIFLTASVHFSNTLAYWYQSTDLYRPFNVDELIKLDIINCNKTCPYNGDSYKGCKETSVFNDEKFFEI